MSLSNRDVTYNVFKSEIIGFSIVNGRKYRCEVSMEDVSFKFSLTDLVTTETTLLTFNNTWSAGTQKDIYGFGWNAGTNAPTITYFEIFEPRNPLVCFLGDSITEGYGMQSDLKNKFTSVAIRSLLNNSIACAASSDNIENVQVAIVNELSIIKPKYAIITIGTNDGLSATSQKYANLKTLLENIDCTPIFNHIPANNYAGHDFTYVNGQIDGADVFNGAYLDVATSINNTPSSGVNTAMFVDGIHPNKAGTQAILRRFISDIPFLFDNDLITEYWEN
jgi:lysophospholipase L1-like esterase